ncbi:hypothetical protein JB92DRAFT_3110334 [Gautieria morchelliformis]|nr:hypothetical protein JB92DRAFT_3110334 [Gautieria morchelliformis]
MDQIPDREDLESLPRIDIQKLCKDNNIKANLRTDEMINALCDLINGKDVPRPLRAASERVASQPLPKGRVGSVQISKASEVSAKKATLQPSEPNTDPESVPDASSSTRATRRKAKHIQARLGKGRPILAGGSGARHVTKVITCGTGRKTKEEEPIPEEDEGAGSVDALSGQNPKRTNTDKARPISPINGVAGGSRDEQPLQLPTPTPCHPSYSLPSAQLVTLQSRIIQLEEPNLAARISEIEVAIADISVLKLSVAQIPVLQDEVKRLEAERQKSEADVAELKARVACLEIQAKELAVENGSLKDHVTELETMLHHREEARDPSMSNVVIHPPEDNDTSDRGNDANVEAAVGSVVAAPAKRIPPSELPNPSPSQPTLGKRTRGPVDTPDVSITEDGTQQQNEGAELAASHRVTKPLRKRPRLDLDPEEDASQFSFLRHGPAGPLSTSTPQRLSKSPPGFFTAGRRVPTPLARTADTDAYLRLGGDDLAMPRAGTSNPNNVAAPSNTRAVTPVEGAPCTPPPRPADAGPSSNTENPRDSADPMHDHGIFGGPLPVYYTPSSVLPFPPAPTTPSNPQDIPERSAQFATSILGEPWKFEAAVNPATISQGVALPPTPTHMRDRSSSSNAVPPESPGNYTFRAGGRRERNDMYNPFFTPQRGPGSRHRTGITPTRGFSFSLKSPPRMATVEESTDPSAPEVDEDGIARSPPPLRTLYGTELEGDTRFGDYGKDLGGYDWGKAIPR